MGLVQQGWVGQSRGKMPLPRFYWQPWERHLAAIVVAIVAAERNRAPILKQLRPRLPDAAVEKGNLAEEGVLRAGPGVSRAPPRWYRAVP